MDETARLAKLYSHKKYVYDYDATPLNVIGPDEAIVNSMGSGSDAFVLENFGGAPLEIPRFHGNNPLATR